MVYTRDRVQGLRRRSNRAHETPMRSRRFVALFGGGTADGSRGLRGDENEGAEGYGSSDRGSRADVGRRDVGGTARHASARATWRETIRANNRQEALLGGNAERRWYSTFLFAGTTKGESREVVIANAGGMFPNRSLGGRNHSRR